jgi:blocked-early-in-transport protein 1
MASRYGSHLTNRGLFANFDDQQRGNSHSPVRPNSGYGNRYSSTPDNTSSYNSYAPPSSGPSFSAYPGDAGTPSNTFRAPTPNRNASGAMSMAELEHLESQGDEQIGSIIGKIGRLKDLSLRIGDEIRDSSKLADTMNDTFSGTSLR